MLNKIIYTAFLLTPLTAYAGGESPSDDSRFYTAVVGGLLLSLFALWVVRKIGKKKGMTWIPSGEAVSANEEDFKNHAYSIPVTQKSKTGMAENFQNEKLKIARDAYWNSIPEDSRELYAFRDTCKELLDIKPSHQQLKEIFDSLPISTIDLVFKRGINDSGVGDAIYEFISEHVDMLKIMLETETKE